VVKVVTRREVPSNGSRRSPDEVAPIAGSEPLDTEAFRSAFEDAPIGMSLVDVAPGRMGQFVRVNAALAELTGYSREALIGMDYAGVTVPEDIDEDHECMRELIDGAVERYQIEKRYVHARGHVVWVIVTVTLVRSRAGAALYAIRQVMDISARKQFEGQLEHLADHDPLTGLFNRRRFEQELSRQLAYARRYGGGGVVAMLDLDHLKEINDTFGHRVGDEALITTAHLWRDRLRATDVLARLGGDEFAIALPHIDQQHARGVLEDLVRAVREDSGVIVRQGRPLTVSIGMTSFGDDPKAGGPDLMVLADVAMYEAKARGGDDCVVYDPNVAVSGLARIARQSWSTRIRDALDRDTFELYGQPIIDLQTGTIVQRETLLRMRDGDDLVLPGAFLGTAERFGLARELDRWVIHHALQQIAGQPEELLTINLSGDSVTDSDIPDYLKRELDASARDPQSIVIEVTETAAIANMDRARAFVTQIKDLGCKIALDDFGAGFGSFYYLKYLPLDFLKIDGEFITHLPASKTDQILVEAIMTMAHGLGQQVIAEHVQDAATVQILRRLGVDHAQGYHLGRPAPITEPLSSAHDAR
jgi:diguanylate cyclase (GGDEF)-like protein/PAS domain S-box-containing protein